MKIIAVISAREVRSPIEGHELHFSSPRNLDGGLQGFTALCGPEGRHKPCFRQIDFDLYAVCADGHIGSWPALDDGCADFGSSAIMATLAATIKSAAAMKLAVEIQI